MPPTARGPLVTVAIPTVSRIDYLRHALASVAAQTYPCVEVVVSENSSDPLYAAAVEALVADFHQIPLRVIHQAPQLSMPENANALLRAARGVYWVYLPDDDRIHPTFLSRAVAALETTPEAAFVFADHWVIRGDGSVDEALSRSLSDAYGRSTLKEGFYASNALPGLAASQAFVLQSMLMRLDVIGRAAFDSRDGVAPDLGLQFRLAEEPSVKGAFYLAERLVDYRLHPAQFTRSASSPLRARDYLATLERFAHSHVAGYPNYRALLARAHLELGVREFASGQRLAAARNILRSLTLDPSPRGVARLALLALPFRVTTLVSTAAAKGRTTSRIHQVGSTESIDTPNLAD